MCSCHRDKKPHSEACRTAHRKHNASLMRVIASSLRESKRKGARLALRGE